MRVYPDNQDYFFSGLPAFPFEGFYKLICAARAVRIVSCIYL